jgi:dipeptidyl aminopeptidase/acylaminoacyl peptidase
MADKQIIPFGAWPSPISAADVSAAGLRLGGGAVVGDQVWWVEGRPAEHGRQAIAQRVGEEAVDVLRSPWNARSRVHEYGGSSWLAVPGSALVFANFADQRLYRQDPGGEPRPVTPEPDQPSALRYAEPVLSPDNTEVWAVREAHIDGAVRRHIVAIPLDGSAADDPGRIREIVGGSDFLAYPTPSPDGQKLAWIAWDHPRMPWDGTVLRVLSLADGSVAELIGGEHESVLQPSWADDGSLYVITDRSGWWNLHRVGLDGSEAPLHPAAEEFGGPLWALGTRWYAPLPDGRLAVIHGTDSQRLGLLDPATGELTDLDLPYTAFGSVSAAGGSVVTVAGAPTRPTALIRVDLASGDVEEIRSAQAELPDAAYLPTPRSITISGVGGRDVHAHVYPPASPVAEAPAGERPPYVVVVHGGPTSQSHATLSLGNAYFTSRGIGVLDVNYGGSTGYGREYRERLRGQWGVVDVEDAVSAVTALVEQGEADGDRLAIRGGSAGGWTTLAALTRTDVFSAGASYYGVAELENFVADTHDFESRYIDGLVGPWPEARELYRERAPLSHVDEVSCPVLLLQGTEDLIVPPSQAEMFVEALARKGIPHAYLLFEGEQHGFRRAANQIAALEAELSFYGQIFGFNPPGVPTIELVR